MAQGKLVQYPFSLRGELAPELSGCVGWAAGPQFPDLALGKVRSEEGGLLGQVLEFVTHVAQVSFFLCLGEDRSCMCP